MSCKKLYRNLKVSLILIIRRVILNLNLWSPARITKIFPNLSHGFWLLPAIERKKQKQNKNHSTVTNNFYFLVSEFWLNLMIVSMFVLESRQVVHSKSWTPNTMTERQCKAQHSPFYFPVYWVEIFQNPNFPKLYANLKSFSYLPESQNTIWSTPTLLCAADFFWPSTSAHSPVASFFTLLYTARPLQRHLACGIVNR